MTYSEIITTLILVTNVIFYVLMIYKNFYIKEGTEDKILHQFSELPGDIQENLYQFLVNEKNDWEKSRGLLPTKKQVVSLTPKKKRKG